MATITSPRSASPAIPHITSPSPPSATNTPTSSVRASIDLSSNPPHQNQTQAQPSTSANPNQRRNRAALRDYYNLKTKPFPSPSNTTGSPAPSTHALSRTASITSTTSNFSSATLTTNADGAVQPSILPPAIDDPTFDADSYIAGLLKTSSLRDILRAESSLVSEIRNLDGERKALVYDNYSKLIVAVGTIGEMQRGIVQGDRDGSGLGRMKGLEGKLDALMKGFEGINGQTAGGGDGDEAKTRVKERSAIREERKKKELVRWVLDAPERLEDLVESGKRAEAEKDWEEVQAVLSKWEGVKGVEDVRVKCKKALEGEDDNEGD